MQCLREHSRQCDRTGIADYKLTFGLGLLESDGAAPAAAEDDVDGSPEAGAKSVCCAADILVSSASLSSMLRSPISMVFVSSLVCCFRLLLYNRNPTHCTSTTAAANLAIFEWRGEVPDHRGETDVLKFSNLKFRIPSNVSDWMDRRP